MDSKEIKKILNSNSVKSKIKLYFIDVAFFNINGTRILDDEQRVLIYEKIKSKNDISYYDDYRIWNKVFLMYKPILENNLSQLSLNTSKINYEILLSKNNNLLEKIFSDLDLKKIVETKYLKELESIKNKNYFDSVVKYNNENNNHIKTTKSNLYIIKKILEKIQLEPYQDYLIETENKIIEFVNQNNALVKNNISYLKNLVILKWEDIETNISEDEIEDLKKLGI
jgi:hypothetical protein